MVVALSPFKHGLDYADVLLPISPYTETSGSFVNCEGRLQSFNGTVRPLGDTRPAWKVLRVLGNLLGLAGFDYETSEAIGDEIMGAKNGSESSLLGNLNNISNAQPEVSASSISEMKLERVTDVPIYFSDSIVRRAAALQKTSDAKQPVAKMSAALAEKLGLTEGMEIIVRQENGSAQLTTAIEKGLPDNVVRIAAAHSTTVALGSMFGELSVERA